MMVPTDDNGGWHGPAVGRHANGVCIGWICVCVCNVAFVDFGRGVGVVVVLILHDSDLSCLKVFYKSNIMLWRMHNVVMIMYCLEFG